jgi:hypothetical protein
MRWYGSLASILCILGRSEVSRNFFSENKFFLSTGSVLFSFSLIALCVHAGCLFIVRTLCVTKMTFMEETVGETRIRTLAFAVSLLSATAGVSVFWAFDDVDSGSAIIIMTGKVILTGTPRANVIKLFTSVICEF